MMILQFCMDFVVGKKGGRYSLIGTCSLPSHTLKMKATLGVYDYVAVPGFHPGYDTTTNRPLFRGGNISSDPRYGHSASIDGRPSRYFKSLVVYETFAYPGSSGSPVFALQKGIRASGGISFPAYRPARLIGIQSMMKFASSGEAGVHSGLSYFVKSSAILEILDSIPME